MSDNPNIKVLHGLIREAADHIQTQRDELFAGHSLHGKLQVLDATDAIVAQAIKDLDDWLLRAKEALQPSDCPQPLSHMEPDQP